MESSRGFNNTSIMNNILDIIEQRLKLQSTQKQFKVNLKIDAAKLNKNNIVAKYKSLDPNSQKEFLNILIGGALFYKAKQYFE